MVVKIDDKAKEAIEAILKRGNNALVYRNKNGVIVSEQIQKAVYRTTQRAE